MKKSHINFNNILKEAEAERSILKHPYVGSEHLFLVILKSDNEISEYLKKYKVTYSSFKKELLNVVGNCTKPFNENLYTPLLRKIIKRSEMKLVDSTNIYENLFMSLLDEGEGIAIRILLRMNVDLDEIYIYFKEKEKLNKMEESCKVGVVLNNIVNLNEKVVFRDQEIKKVILSLTRKKKCNPLLVGPAGVGKTAIVEELARRIVKGNVPDSLFNYKIIMIEMGSLISGTRYRGEFEERLNKVIKEMINSKKTIIFIDEIHTMVGAGGSDGAINASDILKPYLARGDIKCIGATTDKEYNESILKDKALARRFDVINISEPTKKDMYKLLTNIKKEYEIFHNIKISSSAIKMIIKVSDDYIKNIVNPDKSIDILDSSCAYAKLNNKLILTGDDIINTVYYKTNNCFIKKKEFINKISSNLKRYFNNNILNEIIRLFKNRSNLPISFLTNNKNVKDIITNELTNINIINIDLNLISGGLFYDKNINETVFSSLIEKPYSLINIKNIESANKIVIDELIKINNEGYITLKNNEKIYFNNAVIIASVNNGSNSAGFNQTVKNYKINQELVNSFKLDLRNITLCESVLS